MSWFMQETSYFAKQMQCNIKYHIYCKYWDKQAWANIEDLDQML